MKEGCATMAMTMGSKAVRRSESRKRLPQFGLFSTTQEQEVEIANNHGFIFGDKGQNDLSIYLLQPRMGVVV